MNISGTSCSIINVEIDTYPISVPVGPGTQFCSITHACVGPFGSFEINCPGQMLCWNKDWYMNIYTTYECTDPCFFTYTEKTGPFLIGTEHGCSECHPDSVYCGGTMMINGEPVFCYPGS